MLVGQNLENSNRIMPLVFTILTQKSNFENKKLIYVFMTFLE